MTWVIRDDVVEGSWLARRSSGERGARGARIALAMVIAGVLAGPVSAAQLRDATSVGGDVRTLSGVTVTATRIPERAFDVPASIDVVEIGQPTDAFPGINSSEYLSQIPGVLARNRQNYSQGEQVSIRGFGARAAFGIRGIRIYVDGIPGTMPDGQGILSNFDLDNSDRIEVLRGPFSALYGNSSGGVIQIFTADGKGPPQVDVGIGAGDYAARQAHAGVRGSSGQLGYNLGVSTFHTDGYRDHSSAKRTTANAKFDYRVGTSGKLTVVFNGISEPLEQDPQGLTRAQVAADRQQAAASALKFNTRRDGTRQWQSGATYVQQLGEHQSVHAMLYYGQRDNQQFLSVPVIAQRSPLSSGGTSEIGNRYSGTDLRWQWQGGDDAHPLDLTAGIAYDNLEQARTGHENFIGEQLGVVGALRRDEHNRVYNVDQYAQGSWRFAQRWSLMLGARHSVVRFSSHDYYITARNPDDSGSVRYGSTDPVAGLMFYANDMWHLYASYGHGFETPSFIELAYRPGGASGLNFGLRPTGSRNAELGSKLEFANGGSFNTAVFQTRTDNEMAVLTSLNGRTIYQNVGSTRRRGMEAELELPLSARFRFSGAYTRLSAVFRDGFGACDGSMGCTVAAGTRIPGVPHNWLNLRLRWTGPAGWFAGASVNAVGNVTADDAATLVAPGYATLALDLGRTWSNSRYRTVPFFRVDNVFGRKYIGSVIIDQAAGASFEPAPGRTYWFGINVTLRSSN